MTLAKQEPIERATAPGYWPLRWRGYEAEKLAWCAAHPDSTAAERTAALKEIAERLGL